MTKLASDLIRRSLPPTYVATRFGRRKQRLGGLTDAFELGSVCSR